MKKRVVFIELGGVHLGECAVAIVFEGTLILLERGGGKGGLM
jgi:hypothetical protein